MTDLSPLLIVVAAPAGRLTYFVLWRTRSACGCAPAARARRAAETLGVNVYRYKFVAVLVSGALAGLGGRSWRWSRSEHLPDGQTGGRGYIGLAAMIFGNWRPGGMLAGSALFGYTDALQLRAAASRCTLLLLVASCCSPSRRSGSCAAARGPPASS